MVVRCKLKNYMEKKGLSQLKVAQDRGLSPIIIGGLCRNPVVRRIDVNTAEKLLDYFDLKTLDDLYERVDSKSAFGQ